MIRRFLPWLALSFTALSLLGSCNSVMQPATPTAPKYTVTFQSNGGTAVASLTGLVGGSKIGAPATPTKSSNVFAGWFKDTACTQAWNFSTDTVTTDTTLYALWTEVYSVTFNSNGGTLLASRTGLPSGSKITAPSAPTKSNGLFAGWYKDAACSQPWDFSTDTVIANTTLYALWTVVYSVTFDSKGGTSLASITGLTNGSTISAPATPVKLSNVFAGWFKDVACTQAWNFSIDTVTTDTTLYALWTAVGTAGITISKPSTGTITFWGQTPTLTLGGSMTVTATVSGTVQSYAWILDGVTDATQTTAAWIGGSNLSPGPHSLMVVAKVQGVLYSKNLDFLVQ